MANKLEVLLAPAEFKVLGKRDLSRTTCVVFDILRATSSMIRALAEGAREIVPVSEISEALQERARRPESVLAGERHGLRITAEETGGIDFDLGNSPREFSAAKVAGKTVIMTTTNGTRALKACSGARAVVVGAFLNMSSVAGWLERRAAAEIVVVCSGTLEEASYEDTLAAGALCDRLGRGHIAQEQMSDSAHIARQIYEAARGDLEGAVSRWARNGRRLLGFPELREDVAYCLGQDRFAVVGEMGRDGVVRGGKGE